ncbi:uncharacterized protein V2V93DRAFT_391893 [Kockiozyma suomiensis]|uniref:uncharacterized protein n=1 Tax=Kockiozyma suomiensis TaxID=1337062 RepID=UPI003342E8BF
MPSFLRRSSTRRDDEMKITPEERDRMKQRTGNIADPILTAMTEEQPFQISNHQGATTVSPELHVRDMFGNLIEDPDLSNPTRHRSERPLDTIRGFEYAATGDKRLKEQIFRDRLPWEGRHNPISSQSPYGSAPIDDSHPQGIVYDEYGTPISQTPATPSTRTPIQLGSSGAGDPTYDAPIPDNKKDKKKKRGLFGRKKD